MMTFRGQGAARLIAVSTIMAIRMMKSVPRYGRTSWRIRLNIVMCSLDGFHCSGRQLSFSCIYGKCRLSNLLSGGRVDLGKIIQKNKRSGCCKFTSPRESESLGSSRGASDSGSYWSGGSIISLDEGSREFSFASKFQVKIAA